MARQEELGAVVLRPDPGERRRVLLPLVCCGLWLLLLEGLLRLLTSPDPRVLHDPLHPYGCFQEERLAQLVAARQDQPGPLDVVLLGDSVLSSVNNPPGERIEDLLPARLQAALGTPVRVWNLGQGGVRAADQLAALRQMEAALGARRQKLFVVLSSNVVFFSRRHRSPPMLYPCLGSYLRGDRELEALLRLPPPAPALERYLAEWLARHLFLFGQRRRLAEALLGGPPREALRERLLQGLAHLGLRPGGDATTDPNLPWTGRGLRAEQFRASYDFIPPESPEAINHLMTRRLARHLAGWGQAALVVLMPQNHGLLGPLADGAAYHATVAAIARTFAEAAVPFRSYDGLVADSLFTDADHLTAQGNQRLAELLAEDLVPRLRALMGEGG
ncbi:MAG: hypothetical protein RMK29_04740 [Myxococcales bacterium]|nr:hypothetical protein [Myxococcota bacterium]MDW8280996.1 hypothetical protein [Myxococcales bacterium]